jgi:hypothetical protein
MRPIAFGLVVLALAACDRTTHDPGPVAGPPPEQAADVGDGAALVTSFRDDPVVAGQKWIGQRVRLTATVTQVDPNEGSPYLELGGGRFLVVPTQVESGRFGRLKAGAVVTVDGTIDRPTTGVPPLTLSEAVLVVSKP